MEKPVIGLAAAENPKLLPGKHIVNTTYVSAIIAAGGTPLLIPVDPDASRVQEYIPLLDGLLVPGGEDVSPLLYGQDPAPQVTYINADGTPVVVFPQYEIAAGAAGAVEFPIRESSNVG